MLWKVVAKTSFLLFFAFFATGCVTRIAPNSDFNPPPLEPFSAYSSFELEPVTYVDDKNAVNEKAFAKIKENAALNMQPIINHWNASADSSKDRRALVISPRVLELKFVSGGTRFFAGYFAGSSAVVMELVITDKTSGRVIAQPEFFQRAAAMGGAWTVGGTDNHMLARITQIASRYLQENYTKAVGGPTSEYPDGLAPTAISPDNVPDA